MVDPVAVNYLRKIVAALKLASPVCLAGRFEDGWAHCLEASVYGARALERRNIKARPVPCAVLGVNDANTRNLSLGLTGREIFERYEREVGETLDFEAWKAQHLQGVPDDVAPIYMVIRAHFHSEHVLIDLTSGQLGRVTGDDLPTQLDAIGPGDKWPSFNVNGWNIEYTSSPREKMVLEVAKSLNDKGYVDDLHDLIDLALRCKLDYADFHESLAQGLPNYPMISERLGTMMAAPAEHEHHDHDGHDHDGRLHVHKN